MPEVARDRRRTILTVFGTRPEIIKLAPVIRQLDLYPKRFRTVNVSSGQHPDLLAPFVKLFGVRVDHPLSVMRPGQPLSLLFARVLAEFDPILTTEKPDLVLVQGDTTTAAASALAAFHRQIPVGHVEAGLRTDDSLNPFPEETNRRLITKLARWHFAATKRNVRALLREGVPRENVFLGDTSEVVLMATGRVVFSLLIALVASLVILRFLPRLPFGRRLILEAGLGAGHKYGSAPESDRRWLGKRGRASSSLRPAGIAEIEGERVDVVSEGELIDAGQFVEVTRVDGNRIVVRRVPHINAKE